jgi:hypothetical protein
MSSTTKKSSLISEFATVIVDLVADGNSSPSKKDVLTATVNRMSSAGTPMVFLSLHTDSYVEQIETYWSDICRKASEMMDHRQYHLTSSAFYEDGRRLPTSLVDAMKYVVCFGNGRRGKAVGIRFVSEEDRPDAMFLYATQKQVEVVNAALETQRLKTAHMINSPAIGNDDRVKLGGLVLQVAA